MITSSVEQEFLNSILARYSEDGPRLIYADYLDESDETSDRARAELIRVQCALARLPADHPRREELNLCVAELLQTYQRTWSDPLKELAVGFEWRRGILDAVSVDALTFLTHGEELFRRAPVRRIRILDASRYITKLAQCPFLEKIRELDLCGNDLGNGGINILLRTRHLINLESLDLSFNGLCDAGLMLLTASRAVPHLRSLYLSDNGHISSVAVRKLAESPHFSGLRVLDISGNDVSDDGVRAVVQSLSRLHTFQIHNNHIGDAGVAELASSDMLVRMLKRDCHLNLRSSAINSAGVQALVASPAMKLARSIDLSGNYLGDSGVRALAASPNLTSVQKLMLKQNNIGDRGAQELASSAVMSQLEYLDISANRLTRKGVDALWACRRSFRTVLDTAGNFVSDHDTGASTTQAPATSSSRTPERLPPASAPLSPTRLLPHENPIG